jgi:hypothetical protein
MGRSIFQSVAALLSAAALGAAATPLASAADAAVSAPVLNAPGVPQPGFPDFTNRNGSLLAMYAEFNSMGQFISGSETISGSTPGLTSNRFRNLYSVPFDEYAVSPSTVGLGFESVLSAASGFASKNRHESLYLYSSALVSLDSALASGKKLPSFSTTSVSEFTTLPLPAAGWLLGAGLLGLIAISRPRRLDLMDLNASASPHASHASAEKRPHGEALKTRDRNKTSELRWYGAYSSWPGELC